MDSDSNRPRVLLADDHRVLSEGLTHLLAEHFELVGVVEDGRALLAAAPKLRPDIIVADITMPHVNGIEAMVRLKEDNSNIKFVFLTMHQEPAYARRALEAGALGYVVKHAATDELVMAIRAALKGQVFITPALAGELVWKTKHGQRRDNGQQKPLTPRQREVLQLLAQGHSAKEIALALAISARTVEFHKYQMMESYGLRSNAELIHFAIKHGIVTI